MRLDTPAHNLLDPHPFRPASGLDRCGQWVDWEPFDFVRYARDLHAFHSRMVRFFIVSLAEGATSVRVPSLVGRLYRQLHVLRLDAEYSVRNALILLRAELKDDSAVIPKPGDNIDRLNVLWWNRILRWERITLLRQIIASLLAGGSPDWLRPLLARICLLAQVLACGGQTARFAPLA